MYDSSKIAENIKITAIKKKVVIRNMLSDCGLGINTMSSLYHGNMIAVDSLAKIADYLEVSVDYLLGRTNEPKIHGA